MASKDLKNIADFGLIGLAVMGQNLVLNSADKGFVVAVFNRTVSKVDSFLKEEALGSIYSSLYKEIDNN